LGKRLDRAFVALLLLVLAAPAVCAPAAPARKAPARVPFLWEVQTQPKIYLFGTIHIPDPRLAKRLPVVAKALGESRALYTELAFDPQVMGSVQQMALIPDGKTLDDIAPKELVAKLDKVLADNGVPPLIGQRLKRMRPWLVAMQVPLIVTMVRKQKKAAEKKAAEEEEGGEGDEKPERETPAAADPAARIPLDLALYMQAKQGGKRVGGLETPKEQFDVFETLTPAKQLDMLSGTLDAVAKGDEEGAKAGSRGLSIAKLVESYLRGDDSTFQRMMTEAAGLSPDMKALMARLLDKRNVVMVRRMLAKAHQHPDETMFVAVGAAHYGGPRGIVALLRSTGFRVRRLKSLADAQKPWPPVVAPDVPSRSSRRAPRRRFVRVGPFCLPWPCGCPCR
jgi:hypothetical protein